jgi:hypothetical protein
MKDEPISPQDSQMTRWIDALPDAPLPEGVDRETAACERAAAAAVAALLREHVPLRQEPPYPEFFNTQVLKKIRDEEMLLERAPATRDAPSWRAVLGQWLRTPWMTGATAAACTAVAIFAINPRPHDEATSGTRVLTVFSPEPNTTTRVMTAADHSAVVVSVDGLSAFPSDRLVVGSHTNEPQSLVASHQP